MNGRCLNENVPIEKHFDFRLNGSFDIENNYSYNKDNDYAYALFRDELNAQEELQRRYFDRARWKR